jgi:hypothetical protein
MQRAVADIKQRLESLADVMSWIRELESRIHADGDATREKITESTTMIMDKVEMKESVLTIGSEILPDGKDIQCLAI